MEFLYRYYYIFFYLHQRDVSNGIKSGPAWVAALVQLCAGIVMLLFGIIIVTAQLLAQAESLKGANPYLFGITTSFTSFLIVRHLLFNYYEVSFDTGLTPKSTFTISNSWRYFFWTFWLFSVSLPLIASLYIHGYLYLHEIPWSRR